MKTCLALLVLLALTGCGHELDFKGMVWTEVSVEERFEQSVAWNESHPRLLTAPASSYTIVFTGDTHIGGLDNLNQVLANAENEAAVFLAIAGDVTTGNEDDYQVASTALSASFPFDIAVTCGNHDLYFGGWEWFHNYFGSASYTIEVQAGTASDLYIFLDTGSGTLGSSQFSWLKDVLSTSEDYRHVVVTTHVNFFRNRFTGSTNPLNQEILAMLDLFESHKVDLVITGHDHLRYIDTFGHCTYITMDALVDGFSEASWLKIQVGDDELAYSFNAL